MSQQRDHQFCALIAHGDAATRERILRICGMHGLECVTVDTLQAGDAKLEAVPFDIVVTNWVLTGGSGIDLATRALSRRPGCGVILLGKTGSLALANTLLHGEVGAFVKTPLTSDEAFETELTRVFADVRSRPIVDTKAPSGPSVVATGAPPATADDERMREERVKSLPATGGERIDAALKRQTALDVDEGDLANFADDFDAAFDLGGDDGKTRPVAALDHQTDQETSSEAERAFRIRFRSVPGFADAGAGPGTEEDEVASKTRSSVADDEPMEISDEDFQAIEDVNDAAPHDFKSEEAPKSDSAEQTVVFAANPLASAPETAKPAAATSPAASVASPPAATAVTNKKRRRKVPPPSVGTSTVVTSIVARPGHSDLSDVKPSIVVREESIPNTPAPRGLTTTTVAGGAPTVPVPQANRVDTLGAGFDAKTADAKTVEVSALSRGGDDGATAVPLPGPSKGDGPKSDGAVALPGGDGPKSDGAVALPGLEAAVALPGVDAAQAKRADTAIALPGPAGKGVRSTRKDVVPAVTSPASTMPKATPSTPNAAVTPPPQNAAAASTPRVAAKPPAAAKAPVDDTLSADDLSALKNVVGGAESAAIAFAVDVADAFGADGRSGDDETSFTLDFDDPKDSGAIPDRSGPSADGVEKTWVVNTQSVGVVSAELNDEVWTLSQPAEKTGIHVLEDLEHYAIERKLADGKHASVYLARWPGDATPVALKVLSPALSEDIAFRQRFRREIRSQAALSHENVVGVVRYGRRNHSYFLAVELMEGTLQDILRALGRLPTAIICVVLEDILRGIHYAHRRQVIHRELKPSNVFFAASGVAKVGDFGFAKSVVDPNQSSPGLKLGTPAYFSPEQSMGNDLGPRSDLFAVGTLVYEMLTGKNPYQRDTIVDTAFAVTRAGAPEPASVVPTAHALLSQVARKLGARDPVQRYQSALEAIEDLAPLLTVVNKRYPKLRSQFVHAPKDVARQLNADEARLEVNRASKMMSWGDSHRPRAALCYFRASLLDPTSVDAKKGLAELENKYGLRFDDALRKKYGDLEKNLAKDPENAFLLRELADRARDEGDLWGYSRFLRRYLALEPKDQRARNQIDSLIGVDPAAPYGTGRPSKEEKTRITSPKLGHIEREERTGVGLRVPLENKTKLTQAVQERKRAEAL